MVGILFDRCPQCGRELEDVDRCECTWFSPIIACLRCDNRSNCELANMSGGIKYPSLVDWAKQRIMCVSGQKDWSERDKKVALAYLEKIIPKR